MLDVKLVLTDWFSVALARSVRLAPVNSHAIFAERDGRSPLPFGTHDVERHMRETGKAQGVGGSGRHIYDPSPHEWTAVVDAHYNRSTGVCIGDAYHGAERQSAMRRRKRGGDRPFTVGGPLAGISVDGGHAGLRRSIHRKSDEGSNKSQRERILRETMVRRKPLLA
jgi:hypothetical protein